VRRPPASTLLAPSARQAAPACRPRAPRPRGPARFRPPGPPPAVLAGAESRPRAVRPGLPELMRPAVPRHVRVTGRRQVRRRAGPQAALAAPTPGQRGPRRRPFRPGWRRVGPSVCSIRRPPLTAARTWKPAGVRLRTTTSPTPGAMTRARAGRAASSSAATVTRGCARTASPCQPERLAAPKLAGCRTLNLPWYRSAARCGRGDHRSGVLKDLGRSGFHGNSGGSQSTLFSAEPGISAETAGLRRRTGMTWRMERPCSTGLLDDETPIA
jgi:hypothetical protein